MTDAMHRTGISVPKPYEQKHVSEVTESKTADRIRRRAIYYGRCRCCSRPLRFTITCVIGDEVNKAEVGIPDQSRKLKAGGREVEER